MDAFVVWPAGPTPARLRGRVGAPSAPSAPGRSHARGVRTSAAPINHCMCALQHVLLCSPQGPKCAMKTRDYIVSAFLQRERAQRASANIRETPLYQHSYIPPHVSIARARWRRVTIRRRRPHPLSRRARPSRRSSTRSRCPRRAAGSGPSRAAARAGR